MHAKIQEVSFPHQKNNHPRITTEGKKEEREKGREVLNSKKLQNMRSALTGLALVFTAFVTSLVRGEDSDALRAAHVLEEILGKGSFPEYFGDHPRGNNHTHSSFIEPHLPDALKACMFDCGPFSVSGAPSLFLLSNSVCILFDLSWN